ncbi:hypothetical protein [Glaciihabitans sp. dw_435]|uniref:hypothetical protein n=1 Tax=Glaciihabitans sp. dw_435 TaxID=2720081 RepID=UPI001BD5258D|nr:hypothetical protein [Glaciihabitans sp. dw_435]
MTEDFGWVSDVARGEWLLPMKAEPWNSILSVVPRGFEAYARVFHPTERDRPRATGTWLGVDTSTLFSEVHDLDAAIETEQATWAMVAAAFGTTMHAEAQHALLIAKDRSSDSAIAPDGWRYNDASQGSIDAASLAAASAVLARHTSTPGAGVAAVWEGWGGLTSSSGSAVSYVLLESDDDMPEWFGDDAGVIQQGSLRQRIVAAARRLVGRRSGSEFFPGHPFRQPKPGTGVLSREISAGPRFEILEGTGRSYVLFEAGATDFADPQWPARAPWVVHEWDVQSPSIIWPDDHSWVLATEIDFDSTLIAGSQKLVDELTHTPGIEAMQIGPDADLTSEGDRINRPA